MSEVQETIDRGADLNQRLSASFEGNPAFVPRATLKDAVGPRRFRLEHYGETGEVEALDEIHARAAWNDQRGQWPSPREVTCTPIE